MFRRVGAMAALVAAACCSRSEVKSGGGGSAGDAPLAKPTLTLFATAEVRGQIGPCGCTSDPLGDVSRTAQLVGAARAAGPVVMVDAGSLLYAKSPIPPHLVAQEDMKADLLVKTYQDSLHVAALGLGPADLARGVDHLRVPREAANATGITPEAPKVVEAGGAKLGVFGVIAEDTLKDMKVGDPVAAGKAAVAAVKQQGAQVVVALVQASSKRDAVKLVRDIGGIDLAIAGLGIEAPEPDRVEIEPQKVGDGWLVVPVNRGQILARLDFYLRGAGPLADAVGPGAAAAKLASIETELAALDADLAKFAADKTADPAFVAQKQQERATMAANRERLKAQPLLVPAHGSYFTLTQIKINKALACDTKVQDAVTQYFRATGEANVKAAAAVAVPAPAKGAASYVGMEICADCHQDAVDFWKTTVHAQAWKTLEERGQQFDFECIGCHVTGWDKPGGSNLGHNDKLRDVQCETCHGPGSIHVAKGGKEKPLAIQRGPADDLCASQCHTKEHSDTFQFQPYLRDILGEGHGKTLRDKLGGGATGAQLRKAALDKAGRTLGSGCTR